MRYTASIKKRLITIIAKMPNAVYVEGNSSDVDISSVNQVPIKHIIGSSESRTEGPTKMIEILISTCQT